MGIFLNKSYNISHRVQTHIIKSLIMALSLFKLAKYKIKYCLCCHMHSQKRRNKKSQKFLLKDQYQNLMPKIRAFFFHQMLPLASVENSDRIYNTIWHFDRIKKWGCWKKNLIQMTFKAHTAQWSDRVTKPLRSFSNIETFLDFLNAFGFGKIIYPC